MKPDFCDGECRAFFDILEKISCVSAGFKGKAVRSVWFDSIPCHKTQIYTIMNTQTNHLTESQAILMAESMLKEGFTISLMSVADADDFIWGYLYDNGLQYLTPINYVNDNGYLCVALVYQESLTN